MATLAQIRAQVLSMVRDQNGDAASPIEVDSLINRGLLEFCDRTNYLHHTALTDLIDAQAVYSVPEDCLRVIRVAYGEKALVPIAYQDLDCKSSDWRSESGEPTHYLRDLFGHNEIRLYPIPVAPGNSLQTVQFIYSQETGTLRTVNGVNNVWSQEEGVLRSLAGYGQGAVVGTIRIDYLKAPTTLTSDGDTPELPRQYHDCLSSYAAGHLLTRNGDPNRAAPYLAEFENQVSKAKDEVSQTFQPSIHRTIPTRFL